MSILNPIDGNGKYHVVFSGGGSRAVLGHSGTCLACALAGLTEFASIGGVSGGSIPSIMLAAGVEPRVIVEQVIETDFNSLLTPMVSLPQVWWAFFLKECGWRRRSRKGVLNSEKIGAFVKRFVQTWPEKYWTVAVSNDIPLFFTAEGVFEYDAQGHQTLVARDPAAIEIAVRGSCSVPGIIDAVAYGPHYLLDGALIDGRCPVSVVKRLLGATPGTIIASDVGEEPNKDPLYMRVLRKIVCGPCCDPIEEIPLDVRDVILVRPAANNVSTLQFTISKDQKWQTVMGGFVAAVHEFEKAGILSGANLDRAREIVSSYAEIKSTAHKPDELASRTHGLLSKHGLM